MATWFQKLVSEDDMERNTAWGEFLYNEEAVVSILREGCPIPEVLKAGLAWNGAGWTTTRAAVSLRALTSVALVSTDVEDYRDSFLYSLALAAGVEVQSLRLKDNLLMPPLRNTNGGHFCA